MITMTYNDDWLTVISDGGDFYTEGATNVSLPGDYRMK